MSLRHHVGAPLPPFSPSQLVSLTRTWHKDAGFGTVRTWQAGRWSVGTVCTVLCWMDIQYFLS